MASNDTELHPWPPFVPDGAGVIFLGTFPPQNKRRAMEFFYPNPTNDFWKVMGLIMEGTADAYYDRTTKKYRLDKIKAMLTERGIAMGDTAAEVRRLHDNASDKYLEIVRPLDLSAIIEAMPRCRAIAATGEKAATVIASLTGTAVPAMGASTSWTTPSGRKIDIWRLPSTSRAYPLVPEKKAEAYRLFLKANGIIAG